MPGQQKPPRADEIRRLIERVDGQLREAERLRNFVNDRARRGEFWPDRRKSPRIPQSDRSDSSTESA
jgi:hypothetical protein